MTEPTDNELDTVLCNQWPAFSTQATLVRKWVRAAFREAIAKWGAPPQISESDAAYWLRHRALILQAIEDRGFRLVSAGGLFWLSGSAKPSPTPQADSQPALPKITAEDRSFLHYNPNTDDIVEWVCRYASAAITADRAARAPADSVTAPASGATSKNLLQVQAWVIPDGNGGGQFSWQKQDERYWTRLTPPAQAAPQPAVQQGAPVAWRSWDSENSRWNFTLWPDEWAGHADVWEPLYTYTAAPVAQGDAQQRAMDARHAAIYRWIIQHIDKAASIIDAWREDGEADKDELHDALAARAAKEGAKYG